MLLRNGQTVINPCPSHLGREYSVAEQRAAVENGFRTYGS